MSDVIDKQRTMIVSFAHDLHSSTCSADIIARVLIGEYQVSMICRNTRHSFLEKPSGSSLTMKEPWAVLVSIVASFVSACFPLNHDRPACSPQHECPEGFICGAQNICERPSTLADAGIDMSPPLSDAHLCFGNAPFAICLASAPTAPLVLSTTTTFSTDGGMCAATTSGATGYCVLAGTTISFTGTGSWRATGSKPLVLIASGSITVSATLDVSSHRILAPATGPEAGAGADFATCPAPTTAPVNGGGGGGGSFTGVGGAGAASARSPSVGGSAGAAASAIATLRGGGSGRDGEGGNNRGLGGHGGGAALLIAGNSINITATGGINASGQGGRAGLQNTSGGGGGGSGGMIVLDANTVMNSGLLLANGGGGGEGSGVSTGGTAGSDPGGITAASGGSSSLFNAGDGGNGSAGAAAGPGATGDIGTRINNLDGGGGGGGGGAGFIKVPAGATLGTQISPASVSQLP